MVPNVGVAGSPLVPPIAIFILISISFFLASVWYKKDKFRGFFQKFFIIFSLAIGASLSFMFFYLLPQPKVIVSSGGSSIEVVFDHPVSRASMQKSIRPDVPGEWIFEDPVYTTHLYRKLVFYPTPAMFEPNTKYTVAITNIQNTLKTTSPATFSFSFQTAAHALVASPSGVTLAELYNQTTKLNVPAFLQQHGLSCEVSALRMALAYRGVKVSEETLLSQLGVDTTPHTGDTWGNPYNAFVGNVDGRQMVDGYGVYWGPIGRVARMYRNAKEFTGWTVGELTREITNGNPVEIWVYSAGGWLASWHTSDGQYIYAVRDEHTVTVVGFVGDPSDPSQVIVNDPLHGQVYWSRSLFDSKWNIFNRSGVVIY